MLIMPDCVLMQAGYDLVEIPAFNADTLDGAFLQAHLT
jgi:hypothetical protein